MLSLLCLIYNVYKLYLSIYNAYVMLYLCVCFVVFIRYIRMCIVLSHSGKETTLADGPVCSYGTAQFKLHTCVCITRVYLVTLVEHF